MADDLGAKIKHAVSSVKPSPEFRSRVRRALRSPSEVAEDDRLIQIAEIWGEHWHQGQNPQDRIDFFKDQGYRCLVVKASEMRYPEQVLAKVREYVGAQDA